MNLVLQVLAAAQALEKAGQRIFRPHGLTTAKFNVLNLLSDQPGGLRASDLARALIVDRSNVTGLIKRMKKDGLLQEVETAHDRRQHVVALSPKGRAAWRSAHSDYEKGLVALAAGLNPASRKAAEEVLQRLVARAAILP
jgi:MarR family transcriptional regulator, organic hydroperoxide resistance regulator